MSTSDTTCAVCQCLIKLDESTTSCPDCKALYHRDCWEYNSGCGVYGCSQCPPTEHLDSLEIPASFWGQEKKCCPACDQTILAAALRCRHCGATFSTSRPENRDAFTERARLEQHRPRLVRAGIWVLVLGIVPCTAPLAAIWGLPWYIRNRKEIESLQPIKTTVCKLGVSVATGQTIIALLACLLYAVFRA